MIYWYIIVIIQYGADCDLFPSSFPLKTLFFFFFFLCFFLFSAFSVFLLFLFPSSFPLTTTHLVHHVQLVWVFSLNRLTLTWSWATHNDIMGQYSVKLLAESRSLMVIFVIGYWVLGIGYKHSTFTLRKPTYQSLVYSWRKCFVKVPKLNTQDPQSH